MSADKDKTIRLFTALLLPKFIKNEAFRIQKEINRKMDYCLRPIAYDNFHITLKFLGNVSIHHLNKINTLLLQIEHEPIKVEGGGLSILGEERPTPRAVVLSLNGSKTLNALKEKIDDALHPLCSTSKRAYFPHITLFRIRSKVNKQKLKEVINSYTSPQVSFVASYFSLMKSNNTLSGVSYEECSLYYLTPTL